MIGGRDFPGDPDREPVPIDYEAAVRDILRRRRRRSFFRLLGRIPDPRPVSPGQVVLAGLALLIVGWLIPSVHIATIVGAILLILGFASGLIQPRGKPVVWRNRTMVVPPEKRWTDRWYYVFYRRIGTD